MYGDCQVMQMGMGGGADMMRMTMNMGTTISDPLFSSNVESPTPLFLPGDLGYPFHPMPLTIPKEELESGSAGSGQLDGPHCREEGVSAQEERQQKQQHQQQQQQSLQRPDPSMKKKGYHRHTVRQIQEMEALFKEFPHPDEKQRLRLSQELGLKPRQVKFWFQNRRTQMKAQQDRADNVMLRAENDHLKSENFRLQAAIRSILCPNCGGGASILGETSFDEQHLRLENARLKEELERLSGGVSGRYGGPPRAVRVPLPPPPPLLPPSLDLDMGVYSKHLSDTRSQQTTTMGSSCTDVMSFANSRVQGGRDGYAVVVPKDKALVMDVAVAAAKQLIGMCRAGEPLWARGSGGEEERMDAGEYRRMFPTWGMGCKSVEVEVETRVEGSRSKAHLMMNSISLVDAFFEANKWMDLFPSILSSAKTLQVINPGIAGYGDGSLHLMHVELQGLSPLVPSREAYFFRYCQHNLEEGFWTVVDFPADGLCEGPPSPYSSYKRRPSGLIVHDAPNGYSMVTWVEHAEVEDKPLHPMLSEFVHCGAAFGAQRWLAVLQHQCDRLASLMVQNVSDIAAVPSPEARNNLMKLSQRMIRTFCTSISSSRSQSWTALSDALDDTVRITTRKNTELGQPNGVVLSAVSTTWMPFTHLQVFELLSDESRRSQLDVLTCGSSLHKVASIVDIANEPRQKSSISLLRIDASCNSSRKVELMLQDASTHPAGGSVVVYSTMDFDAVQIAMSGEDTSYIPLLPTGFIVSPATAPVCVSNAGGGGGSSTTTTTPDATGCLLTVGQQVITSAVSSAKINLSSVTAINNHLRNVVQRIRFALGGAPTLDPTIPVPDR